MSSLIEKAIILLIAGGFWYMFFGSHTWLLFNAPSAYMFVPLLLIAPIALILIVTKVIELPWRN